MAIPPKVRDDVEAVAAEGAVDALNKSSPASSTTTSDAPDETWVYVGGKLAHLDSAASDDLSLSSTSLKKEVPAIPIPPRLQDEAPYPQLGFIIYPIDQSPTGSWGNFQGGADLPQQTVTASPMHYDPTQVPMDYSGQLAQVGSGNSYHEDVDCRSESMGSIVSDGSDNSMDVHVDGYASDETRVRGRGGRYTASVAASDPRPPRTSGARRPSPSTLVREFDNKFDNLNNLTLSANINSIDKDSSSGE